jgi:maltose/moltooligosaccharide transporter
MPKTMIQLAVVQFFTWYGLNAMWAFMTPTVALTAFGATDPQSAGYQEAGNWVGVMFAMYSGVAFSIAFLLPVIAKKTSRKITHAASLVIGGLSLISILFIHDKYWLLLPMVGVGIAWASLLSMPYAILVGALPEGKLGYFVGVFNFFIVIPQLVASTTLGPILKHLFHDDTLMMCGLAGVSFLVAASTVWIIQDKTDIS